MPTPVYDNAWLRAREERRKLGTTIEKPIVPEQFNADSEDYGDPVAEARRYLETAPDYSGVARLPQRLAELQQGKRPSIRSLTEPLAKGGAAAGLASLPMMLTPAAPYAAATGLVGAAATVPDMIARSLDDDPTNDPGLVEGLISVAGLLPGASKLFRGTKTSSTSAAATKLTIPPPWRDTGHGLRAAEPVARPTVLDANEALAQLMTRRTNPNSFAPGGLSSSGLPRAIEDISHPTSVKWQQNEYAANKDLARRILGEQVEPLPGQGTTPWQDTGGGMRAPAPSPRAESLPAGPEIDLSARLGATPPAAQLRAKERFGRIFRSETGGAGTRQTPEIDLTEELSALGPVRELPPSLQPLQAGMKPANLLADPGRALAELRQELARSTDPAEQNYLRRAINQQAMILRKMQERQQPIPANWTRFRTP